MLKFSFIVLYNNQCFHTEFRSFTPPRLGHRSRPYVASRLPFPASDSSQRSSSHCGAGPLPFLSVRHVLVPSLLGLPALLTPACLPRWSLLLRFIFSSSSGFFLPQSYILVFQNSGEHTGRKSSSSLQLFPIAPTSDFSPRNSMLHVCRSSYLPRCFSLQTSPVQFVLFFSAFWHESLRPRLPSCFLHEKFPISSL